MADGSYQVSPGVKLKAEADSDFAALANSREVSQVWLWDVGPQKPVAPARPAVPKGKEGDPDFDLALIEFKEALGDYEAALKAHKAAKAEHARFSENEGGAVERMFWSCDAQDALARDPKRYFISSRTRGYERAPNRGLPEGVKPGKGQAALEGRERAGLEEFAAARRADPVFGSHEARA